MKRRKKQQKKNRFFFLKLDLFTNNIFNIPIREKEKLFTALFTLFITYCKTKSTDNYFFPIFSNNNFLPF